MYPHKSIDAHAQRLAEVDKGAIEVTGMACRRARLNANSPTSRGYPDPLSRGELRRAELAFAITRMPSVLIADQPYRGITPADHVTWCTDGTTYELGPPEQACEHDAFRRTYLGPRFGGFRPRRRRDQ
jgi:ABC-type multidrug transport system ATPase subunit